MVGLLLAVASGVEVLKVCVGGRTCAGGMEVLRELELCCWVGDLLHSKSLKSGKRYTYVDERVSSMGECRG